MVEPEAFLRAGDDGCIMMHHARAMRASSTVILVQRHLGGGAGGWLMLASGVEVVPPAVSGFFRWRCCGCGRVRTTSMDESVQQTWCRVGQKPPLTLSVSVVAAPLGVASPVVGTIVSHHVSATMGSLGETPSYYGRATTVDIVPSLEALHLESCLRWWQRWWLH